MASKDRFFRLLSGVVLLLLLGVAYAAFVHSTGLAIPCPIHLITGLWCPGCGVTRMCLSLLMLDIPAAFRANPAVLLLLVPLIAIFLTIAWRYVVHGTKRITRRQNIALLVMVVLLVAAGILRNFPAFSFLAPH